MLEDRNAWITLCFGLYLVSILIFAAIYRALYRRRPHRFLIAAGLQDSQVAAYSESTSRRIAALEAENEALQQIEPLLKGGGTPTALAKEEAHGTLPSGARYRIYTTPNQEQPVMDVLDAKDTLLRSQVRLPTGWPWQRRLDEVFLRRRYDNQAQIEILDRRLESLSSSPHEAWSYWDFLYFSAISQTTAGFGDILPNATSVRMLVVGQILLGYALLVVLLNLVFRS